MHEGEDRELLEKFVRGDEAAFLSLFRRYQHDVFRWILRIVRDSSAAEDALADAFWRAYRGRARFEPSRSFGAWMRRIASNAALDQLRTLRRHAPRIVDQTVERSGPASADGLREAIDAAFRRLPSRLQAVAALALIEEQPYAEIADALDLPIGTVKSRVFRAIRILRKELARMGARV